MLFEAISFFKQVASARGWFTLDIEFAGLTSQTGISAVIFLLAFTAEYVQNHKPEKLSSIPEKALFPPKLVKNILFIIKQVFLSYSSILVFFTSPLIIILVMWGRIANNSLKQGSADSEDIDNTVLYSLGILSLISLFFAITTNYRCFWRILLSDSMDSDWSMR